VGRGRAAGHGPDARRLGSGVLASHGRGGTTDERRLRGVPRRREPAHRPDAEGLAADGRVASPLITRAQHGAVIDHWTRGTFGKALDDSLDADRAESVRHAEAALVLQAEVVDPRDLGYLRDFAQILARAQSAEVVATLDVYAVKWATPDAVQEAATHPGFRVRDHLSTTAANDPQYAPGLRLHSRGAIKLGRPELEVRHIRPDARALRGAAMIVEGALKLLADGLEPTDGGNYVLPGFTEHFSVVTSPDDSQGAQHFMNRSAEIRDCTLTSKVGPDASALLAEAEGRVRA
jgi:hypothetical protein